MAGTSPESGTPVKRRIDWWLIALLLIPVLYFLPEIIGTTVFAGIDSSRLNMPFRYFDRQAFAAGSLPLWNPYLYAGFPGFAESESGVFYPGSIFAHLPGDFFHWYSVSVVAHLMVAAAGFYTWMRMRGHQAPIAAFLAATYCTTPFLIFHITAFGLFTSIAWLPWYLVIFDTGMRSGHPVRTGLWLALFLGLMLMSGSSHAAYLGALALVCYAVGRILAQPDAESRKRALVRSFAVLVPCLLSPVLAAVQILPTMELASLSERASIANLDYYELGTWLTIPRLASMVIFPALGNPVDIQDYGSSLCFLGVVPFVLAVATIARYRSMGRTLFPLMFAGAISLILAFGTNLPGYTTLVEIPPFSLFRYAGRSAHVAFMFFLPLAAPTIELIWRGRIENDGTSSKNWWIGYLVGTAIVLLVGIAGLRSEGALKFGSIVALVIGIMVLLLGFAIKPNSGSSENSRRSRIVLVGMLGVSLIAQGLLLYPFSRVLVQERGKFDESLAFFDDVRDGFPVETEIPRIVMAGGHQLMDPDTLDRLGFRAQIDIYDNMAGNAPGLGEVTAIEGLTPLLQENWKMILRDTLQVRMGDVGERALESGEPKIPDDISMLILRMLGADIILLEGSDWSIPGYDFWRDDLALPYHEGLAAYRSADGHAPDAYFVSQVDAVDHIEYADFLRWLGRQGRDIDREAIVVRSGDSQQAIAASPGPGRIIRRERGFNRLAFDVEVPGPDPAFLVTGENFYPGWRAFVDGERVPYYQTDFLLGGVSAQPGSSRIELRFQPESFIRGMSTSFTGILVWLLLMGVAVGARRKGKTSFIPPIEEST